MKPFSLPDYIDFQNLLSEEERLVANSIRKWVEDNVIPIIADHFQNATFPKDLISQMGKLGLFGCNLPEKYGCPGLSNVQYGLAMMELERGDSGIRSFASVQGSLVMYPIYAFGNEQQKQKLLPKLAKGELIGCFGLTEPDSGSNPASMRTTAKKDGKDWILNGSKMWITNGSLADLAIVWAKTDDGIRGFLIEKGTPGFTANKIQTKMSLRASDTSELSFQDCRIPESNILPQAHDGIKNPLMCLNQARYGIAFGTLGAAMACYQAALDYANERIQFHNKPIASHQLIQEKLVTMMSEISKAQLLTLHIGRLKDQNQAAHHHISLIKRNNVYWAREIARMAREIMGANGISTEYIPIRHMLNLESVYTYEGTHDIHTLILGKKITGHSAF